MWSSSPDSSNAIEGRVIETDWFRSFLRNLFLRPSVKSHQRELVDRSDPFYQRSWHLTLRPQGAGGKRRAVSRKDLNYPPTAVGGICARDLSLVPFPISSSKLATLQLEESPELKLGNFATASKTVQPITITLLVCYKTYEELNKPRTLRYFSERYHIR